MLKQCLRSFAYIPKNKLEFKDGKCLLMEEKTIKNTGRLLNSSLLFSVPFSFFISSNFKGLVFNAIFLASPFYFYHVIWFFLTMNCIRKLYLDEDGKNILVQRCFSKTLHRVSISKIEFGDEMFFDKISDIKVKLIIDYELTALISKSSEIYHKDVLDRVFECEEIQVNSLDE
ncbi:hypothetical protein SteCoe_6268 [Stentor coeruleus]|uniref:Uncharacterized protein n=1 Tax=Stentor coeruleus TaxID=5963 RepID=A0A1R2CQF6_9CILI|nr:hypothetical protein SteCoe_6268 [Stentor coeruleus]